ncbi:cache domain-containing protein [Cohnella sp. GCM10020058]|uniref:cache domain-containing protein n=1 Tax=Cohnella sp. GCM10020058 TaxID=3317330 RepID=UPI00362FBF02
MFRSLDRKMKMILFTVIVAYVVLSSVLVFGTIDRRSADMQRQLSLQYTGQQHKNAQLFMTWMEEMASLVTNNAVVREALSAGEYDDTIPPILDGMISSNLYILEMAVYGNDGIAYASNNIPAVRPLDQIEKVPEYAAFLSSDLASEWMIQAPGALAYANTDPRRKWIYAAKIKDASERTGGLLLMTVDMKKLNSFYHADDPDLYGRNPTYILTHDQAILNASGWEEEPDDPVWDTLRATPPVQEMTVNRTSKGIVILYRLYHSDDRMAILISDAPVKSELRLLRYTLIGVGLFILALFYVLIRRLSRSILDPLKALYKKMRRHHEL